MGINKNLAQEEETLLSSSSSMKRMAIPLLALNHVSFVCKSVRKSVDFYQQVLGFVLIKRPSSFQFEGAWLFNHGIGIHLLEGKGDEGEKKGIINPKDNHISFECSNMGVIMENLKEMEIEYVTAVVKEGGITVDQLFFHDPDGYMIEICNCQNLPLLPLLLPSSPLKKPSSPYVVAAENMKCSAEVDALNLNLNLMMERLTVDMMNIYF